MKERKNRYTTISVPVSLHEKMKKVYRAHGGAELFRNLYTFLDVLLDYAIHTDTDTFREILLMRDKRLEKHPEFKTLLEQLRKEITLPPSVIEKARSPAPPVFREEVTPSKEEVAEDPEDIDVPDIPPHQIL